MNRKTVIVNIYNFIRMSHKEPSTFLEADFDTIRRELILVKQHGFPGTYALKYDALMEPRYQALMGEYLDENDELSAWWEITEPLCRRAGVPFRGHVPGEVYDDRVDSAYSVGYPPEDRKKLVDAYMADFYGVFGKYPETISSWVLDSVTLAYAQEQYGVVGGAICRDQMGTDGFTLWGGWPNGLYYPSRKNEFIPAQTAENQIPVPMFRLLGPDPIYNFEADVRDGLQGVYTLEPSWITGRDPKFIHWLFNSLTEEDALGVGYAQVGQENNFLWENIAPGLAPQLDILEELVKAGRVRVETMAASARWFRQQYRLTPPLTFQASRDWDKTRNLGAMWYASPSYRLGFLTEDRHLRIRDLFLFREDYPSRYLAAPLAKSMSTFDALPLLSPQLTGHTAENRPYLRLVDGAGEEPTGSVCFRTLDKVSAQAVLEDKAVFTMTPGKLVLRGPYRLRFDFLPPLEAAGHEIRLCRNGFSYSFRVERGALRKKGAGLEICPENGEIALILGPELEEADFLRDGEVSRPAPAPGTPRPVPPMAPKAEPESAVFPWGTVQTVALTARSGGEIRYTTDGSEPTEASPRYEGPLTVTRDTRLLARVFLPEGRVGETGAYTYRFGLKNMTLTSPTHFDPRPVFGGDGVADLLQTHRAAPDFICGRWRGTLEDLDVTAVLPEIQGVKEITLGFLSHHRGGIILPRALELYTGPDAAHLTLREVRELPCQPLEKEIQVSDVTFRVEETIGAFRLLCRRYDRMPQWCCYRGAENVFTMADCLVVTPMEEGK